jgi:hypothetical protein
MILLLSFLCVSYTVPGETSPAQGGLAPKNGPNDLGLLFTAPSLLMEIQSYNGGIGVKVGSGPLGYRLSLDVVYNSSAYSFNVNGSFAVEYHLIPGPVSPYVGGIVGIGWARQEGMTSMVPLTAGAIAGVEVFLLDFLSVYAEYNLTADLTFVQDLQTQNWSSSLLLDSKVGNNARLGIVIYFMRQKSESTK